MKTYTLETIMAARPCEDYTSEHIQSLCPGRDAITALELCDLETVPVEDRIWALLSCGGDHVAPAIERIVRRAVETYALHCGVPEVEEWARKWLDGTDRSEAAAWAAWAASMAEVMAAAWAARAAARAAAEAAAAAAVVATWAASWAAEAAEASLAAERDRQLQDIRDAIVEQG